MLYLAGQNLYVINAETGQELWRYPLDVSNMVHSTRLTRGDGLVYMTYDASNVLALGNLSPAVLITDVSLLGAPAAGALERGTASAGDEISAVVSKQDRNGIVWAEVTIGTITGWIPLDAIDPATLPPEGEIEYVYMPE